jgi:hypothetical protein
MTSADLGQDPDPGKNFNKYFKDKNTFFFIKTKCQFILYNFIYSSIASDNIYANLSVLSPKGLYKLFLLILDSDQTRMSIRIPTQSLKYSKNDAV